MHGKQETMLEQNGRDFVTVALLDVVNPVMPSPKVRDHVKADIERSEPTKLGPQTVQSQCAKLGTPCKVLGQHVAGKGINGHSAMGRVHCARHGTEALRTP